MNLIIKGCFFLYKLYINNVALQINIIYNKGKPIIKQR